MLCGVDARAQAAPETYQQNCAACHGADRFGGMGPALLPENLERLKRSAAEEVIAQGRHATQMPAFNDKLSTEQIKQLVDYIYTPLPRMPVWSAAEIERSRVVYHADGTLPARPVFTADPLNLFVVVEAGDHHVTILDGDRLEPLTRFATRYALHGGPKFSPDGRYVYFVSRDGWISKYDLWNLMLVAEVRAGINTRNAAVSGDGKYVAVGNYLPHTLAVLDARDLSLVRILEVADQDGKTSRVSAVYDAGPRRSFVAALKDIPEIWELSYDPSAEPVYEGMVHDYQFKEGLATPGQFTPRRTQLDEILDDFIFDPSCAYVIGAARDSGRGQVVNLDVRRKIADVPLPGLPHLGSGITWERGGSHRDGHPQPQGRAWSSVIDMKTWKPVKQIATLGPGFLHAQPREHALRLDRRLQQRARGQPAGDRQAHAGSGEDPAPRARQDRRPRRVHPRRPLRAGQRVGDGRCARRVRRGDVPAGGQAHPDAPSRSASTTCSTRSCVRAGRATRGESARARPDGRPVGVPAHRSGLQRCLRRPSRSVLSPGRDRLLPVLDRRCQRTLCTRSSTRA